MTTVAPPPPATQAALRADPAYLGLLEAESTWALKYNFSRPNPAAPRRLPIQGLNNPAPGPSQIDALNTLLPINYRVQTRAAHDRPQTELFGRAPYVALGRGVLNHVDTSTQLQQGNPAIDRTRQLSERQWYRADFVSPPKELTQLPFETRKSAMTRVAPDYAQPRDGWEAA